MCSICGVHGPHRDPEGATRTMMARLGHRGPDGDDTARVGATTLGHTRLAIVDPGADPQPHRSEDGLLALTANGEIYNHERLRAGLSGHRFASRIDTEAALHLFEERGLGFVEALDGMYALAASDGRELVLARDPLGIKPLYVAQQGEAILFASEMKALEPFDVAIHPVPPGTLWRSGAADSDTTGSAADDPWHLRAFDDIPDGRAEIRDPDEAAQRVRAALADAVRKRLMSDVPLGAFLSGGLDSSAIAALARQEMDELHTFAVGVPGSPDLAAARRVAEHLGTVHHEHRIEPDEVREALPSIVRGLESFDRDLIRSCVPTYFTARLAARHVKVILTGEGADELFAGYAYHKGYAPEPLAEELTRSLRAMHAINLQRVDRMTMLHGLEGRVPFLDRTLVDVAQCIDPRLKIREVDGRPVEKWVLRRAVADLLPAEITARDKAQFDEGSGSVDLLEALVREATPGGGETAAPEARHYRDLFDAAFQHPERLAANVDVWADDRVLAR